MHFTLPADPHFSLAAAADFARTFPGTRTQGPEDVLSFAWAVDGDWTTVSVELRQDGTTVHGEIAGSPSPELLDRVRHDVRLVLCLDVDGRGFTELAARDPVVAGLQERFPGLRPVLFYTPYESAAWCIIGQRIRMTQATAVMRRLGDELGELGAFPSPTRLAGLTGPQAGLTGRKVDQLRRLGEAAGAGALDRDRLRQLSAGQADRQLRQLAGIGPFSAELITIRGVGAPDALPLLEDRLARAARTAYGLAEDVDIAPVAQQWRPYRSWVGLLLRASVQDAN